MNERFPPTPMETAAVPADWVPGALPAAWEAALPPKLRQELVDSAVRSRIAGYKDDAYVSAELAAIYCCVSPATMKRRRGKPGGPDYSSASEEGDTARNQKVSYRVGALKEWMRGHETKGTANASANSGATGFATLSDTQPFWRASASTDSILGHALFLPTEFRELEALGYLEWLDWDEALALPWAAGGRRELFEPLYVADLNRALRRVAAGAEATVFLAATEGGSSG